MIRKYTVVVLLLSLFSSLTAHNNEIGTNFVYNKQIISSFPDEIDLLKQANVNNQQTGVALVKGPFSGYPAFKFRSPFNRSPLNNSQLITTVLNCNSSTSFNENRANDAPSADGFTTVFLYRQQKNNIGTLISINSPGRLKPWFQITSNSKLGILSVKYRIGGTSGTTTNKIWQIEWPLLTKHRKISPMAAWIWLSVTVDFKRDLIRLDVDCLPSRFESLTQIIRKKSAKMERKMQENAREMFTSNLFHIPKDALVYFQQEPGRKKIFLGSMQVAKILPFIQQQRLWSCVQISDNAPAQFRKPFVE